MAALVKRMVTMGVRKTAIPEASASSRRALGALADRETTMQGMGSEQRARKRLRTSESGRLLR